MKIFFRYFFRLVRIVLGPVLLFLDKITTPKGIVRPATEQAALNEQTRNLTLYQFKTCPFCIKVRRAIKRQSLNIAMLDAQHDTRSRQQLLDGGGRIKVPCLKISQADGQVEWIYESQQIIQYLQRQYA